MIFKNLPIVKIWGEGIPVQNSRARRSKVREASSSQPALGRTPRPACAPSAGAGGRSRRRGPRSRRRAPATLQLAAYHAAELALCLCLFVCVSSSMNESCLDERREMKMKRRPYQRRIVRLRSRFEVPSEIYIMIPESFEISVMKRAPARTR